MEGSHEPESVLGVLLPVAMLPIGVHDRGSLARIMQSLAKLQRQLLFGRATTVQVLSRNKLSLAGKPCPQINMINLSWVNCTVLVQLRGLDDCQLRWLVPCIRSFKSREHSVGDLTGANRQRKQAQTGSDGSGSQRLSHSSTGQNFAMQLCQAMPSCLESGCGIKELLCSQLGISREPVESGKNHGALATP